MTHYPGALIDAQRSTGAGHPLQLTGAGAGTRAWTAAHPGAAVVVLGGTSAVPAAVVAGAGG